MQESSPQIDLLLCCARSSLDSQHRSRIERLVRGPMDWEYLAKAASRHGLTPLVCHHLSAVCPAAVPGETLARLQEQFGRHARRGLVLTGELLRILAFFESEGIAAVPFKGPVFGAAVYGDVALRPFDDLDILVADRDVSRARDLLVSQGFRPQFDLTPTEEAAYLRTYCARMFGRDAGNVMVDLHWAISEALFRFPLDPRGLWDRLEGVSLGGRLVPSLSAEDLLLILCVHGCKHFWLRLAWVCDVAELLAAREALAWDDVMDRADGMGARRMLLVGVTLAHDLLGAALPAGVAQAARSDPAARSLRARARGFLLDGAGRVPTMLEGCRFHLGVHGHIRDKARYCLRAAACPTVNDWRLVRLQGLLFPLYWLIRPIRLAGKHGLRVVRRAHRVNSTD